MTSGTPRMSPSERVDYRKRRDAERHQKGLVMTPERLAHFRDTLRTMLADSDRGIGQARLRAAEPITNAPDDAGAEAVRDLLVDTSLEVGELRTRAREDIEDALSRIEHGDYGICEECGEPIELARLEAMPTSRFCADDARRRDVTRRPTL
jgi:DnaK suppressor protein